jgi:hypothetical protein
MVTESGWPSLVLHDVDKHTLIEQTRKNYLRAAELGSKEPRASFEFN